MICSVLVLLRLGLLAVGFMDFGVLCRMWAMSEQARAVTLFNWFVIVYHVVW